jgi:hydroxymethylbilane synthase
MAPAFKGRAKIRLGTRGSRLALAQTEWLAARLRDAGHDVGVVPIVTEGDVRPPDTVPGEGIFVTAIANALLRGEIDVAVHSAKDVPLVEEPELVIASYPHRADARDALVTRSGNQSISTLPANATVGTDSPRRAGFLRAARGDVRVVALHGNVDTRLRRLDEGEVDGLLIAAAGLDRLGRGDRIDERVEVELVTPAPAQGALAVQTRRDAHGLLEDLATLDRPDIRLAVEAERRVLAATGGTCRAPVGAIASVDGDWFTMVVGGVNSDGTDLRVTTIGGRTAHALTLAEAAGRELAAAVMLR